MPPKKVGNQSAKNQNKSNEEPTITNRYNLRSRSKRDTPPTTNESILNHIILADELKSEKLVPNYYATAQGELNELVNEEGAILDPERNYENFDDAEEEEDIAESQQHKVNYDNKSPRPLNRRAGSISKVVHHTTTHHQQPIQNQATSSSSSTCLKYLLSAFLFVVFGLIGIWLSGGYLNKHQDFSTTIASIQTGFQSYIEEIQARISVFSQPKNTQILIEFDKLLNDYNQNLPDIGKNVLRTAFSKALDANEKSPVVVLMIASTEQNDIVRTLSHQIANLRETGVPSKSFSSAIKIKQSHTNLSIENFFTNAFEKQGHSVLVLEDLEQLNPDVAMAFHQFVDGENSRIHSSFIIITLKYNQKLTIDSNLSLKRMSEISTSQLEHLWNDTWSKDNLDCLINRIAQHTVVLINK